MWLYRIKLAIISNLMVVLTVQAAPENYTFKVYNLTPYELSVIRSPCKEKQLDLDKVKLKRSDFAKRIESSEIAALIGSPNRTYNSFEDIIKEKVLNEVADYSPNNKSNSLITKVIQPCKNGQFKVHVGYTLFNAEKDGYQMGGTITDIRKTCNDKNTCYKKINQHKKNTLIKAGFNL
ncbi:hypothetical protein [Spartinivicinus poritis]|uniref:Uncharacterized protein n=1 Tax=Spartinivicinus poritis TaxID=2994640 RepID=A0ABT5U5U0_9GAMM|nr:hypothetical protein [Spartinivicinus sp. A2-2]MDE1461356.1 hypothetical protein [Spartinivicinus sp. A2-2]